MEVAITIAVFLSIVLPGMLIPLFFLLLLFGDTMEARWVCLLGMLFTPVLEWDDIFREVPFSERVDMMIFEDEFFGGEEL